MTPRWWSSGARTPADVLQPLIVSGYHAYRLPNNYWPWRYLWPNDVRPPQRVHGALTERVSRLDLVLSRVDAEQLCLGIAFVMHVTTSNQKQRSSQAVGWLLAGIILIVVVALAAQLATNIRDKGQIFDEQYITVPIVDLIEQGWSVETAIDFVETKGPGLIWPYALLGEVVGSQLNDLRLISVGFFVLGGWLTLALSPSPDEDAARIHQLIEQVCFAEKLGFMSEPSFICGGVLLMLVFVISADSRNRSLQRLGPIAVFALLSILLHNRIHAVAFAGAICLTAFERDRFRSWPWWLACALAGASRLPLWMRWGGLVSPEYQSMHGLGLGPENMTYLAAALLPFTGIFLVSNWSEAGVRQRLWMVWGGGAAGLLLGIFASPSMTETVHFLDRDFTRFKGFVGTGVRLVSDHETVQAILIAAMSTLGLASLGALAAIGFGTSPSRRDAALPRLAFWTLACGIAMYVLTHGFVFDRYLLPWAVLLPIVWVQQLPRWALAVQSTGLVLISGWLAWTWLW